MPIFDEASPPQSRHLARLQGSPRPPKHRRRPRFRENLRRLERQREIRQTHLPPHRHRTAPPHGSMPHALAPQTNAKAASALTPSPPASTSSIPNQPQALPEKKSTTPHPSHPITHPRKIQPANPKASLPELSWAIRLQGDWQKSLSKGHAAITLTHSDSPSTPADSRITSWLLSQKRHLPTPHPPRPKSPEPPHLPHPPRRPPHHLPPPSLPLSIETGAQLHLADCSHHRRTHPLHSHEKKQPFPSIVHSGKSPPPPSQKIGSSTSHPTRRTHPHPHPPIAEGKPCRIPLDHLPFTHLDTLQSHLDFSASEWFESLQFTPATPEIELTLNGSERQLTAHISTSYSQSLPSLVNNRIFTENPTAESEALQHGARLFKPLPDGTPRPQHPRPNPALPHPNPPPPPEDLESHPLTRPRSPLRLLRLHLPTHRNPRLQQQLPQFQPLLPLRQRHRHPRRRDPPPPPLRRCQFLQTPR